MTLNTWLWLSPPQCLLFPCAPHTSLNSCPFIWPICYTWVFCGVEISTFDHMAGKYSCKLPVPQGIFPRNLKFLRSSVVELRSKMSLAIKGWIISNNVRTYIFDFPVCTFRVSGIIDDNISTKSEERTAILSLDTEHLLPEHYVALWPWYRCKLPRSLDRFAS